MMTAEQVIHMMAVPYKRGGRDLQGMDCWGLLAYCATHFYGKQMPEVIDLARARDAYEAQTRNGKWARLKQPEDGCGVLLRGGNDPHVGIYIDVDGGMVLHALESVGVCADTPQKLALRGYGLQQWYRFNG